MIELSVQEMTCGHCVRSITTAINQIDPKAIVVADLSTKRVRVDSDRATDEFLTALASVGYSATPADAQ